MGERRCKWLAHRDRRRWHLHFAPTSSSWLNLIERWFKELTDRRLRRGVFTNVPELEDAITTWAGHWNNDPKPFLWRATAVEIIEKVQRGRAARNRQIAEAHCTDCNGPGSGSVDGNGGGGGGTVRRGAGGLRQDPGRAAESSAEARTYGNGSHEMWVLLSTTGSRGDATTDCAGSGQ